MLTVVEHVLSTSLRGGVNPPGWTWLATAQAESVDPSPKPLLNAYACASLHVGRRALPLSDDDIQRLRAAAPGIGFELWSQDDAARAVLLIARRKHGRTGPAFVADAVACFEEGDAREQQSWLRAIALWPEAADFLPHAIEACRTNIIPVFESLACENPYPARYFPELNFNQMVLKALFNSIALSRVVGLASRVNAELTRMARDYAAERTAAGRTVPPDIGLAIAEPRSDQEQRS